VGQMNFEMSCCSACRLKNGQHMRLPWIAIEKITNFSDSLPEIRYNFPVISVHFAPLFIFINTRIYVPK
ncbi:hypothetical protein Q7Y00_03500, partial [Glaesserella parasuis]|nr:hypothetical protein [Glaesserella parasuis]MDP0453638.1 hypothetical protein [Glaesserella parasuis]